MSRSRVVLGDIRITLYNIHLLTKPKPRASLRRDEFTPGYLARRIFDMSLAVVLVLMTVAMLTVMAVMFPVILFPGGLQLG